MDLIEKAVLSYNERNYGEALTLFRRALAAGRDTPEVRCFLAMTLHSLGRSAEAATEQRRVIAASPTFLPAYRGLASVLASQGRHEAAAEILARAGLRGEASAFRASAAPGSKKKAPKAPRRRAPRADLDEFCSLMKAGRFKEAFKTAESILDRGATLKDVKVFWNPWGGTAATDPSRAPRLRALDRLASSATCRPWVLYYRGALRDGDAKWADYERLAGFPQRRYGWMNLKIGHDYIASERFAEGIAHLKAALRHEPVNWWTHGHLAEALLCLGKERAAREEMRRAARTAPALDKASALAWEGEFELWLGRYKAAFRLLDDSCRRGFALAFCWRGAAVLKMGEPKRALALLDQALEVLPGDREAHVWRAETQYRLGRHEEALLDLEKAAAPFWGRVLGALMKDEEGSRADFAGLPGDIVAHIRRRLRLPEGSGERKTILEGALKLARGYRREEYSQKVWVRAARDNRRAPPGASALPRSRPTP